MNLWIETARDSLVAAIGEVDCVLLNDAEIRMLTGEPNLARAARALMEMGPKVVVAKRGEYGAALFTEPTTSSRSPASCSRTSATRPVRATPSPAGSWATSTSAAPTGDSALDGATLRQAMAYGTVLASFNVEDFGTSRVSSLTRRRDRRAPRGLQADGRPSSHRPGISPGGRGGSSAGANTAVRPAATASVIPMSVPSGLPSSRPRVPSTRIEIGLTFTKASRPAG